MGHIWLPMFRVKVEEDKAESKEREKKLEIFWKRKLLEKKSFWKAAGKEAGEIRENLAVQPMKKRREGDVERYGRQETIVLGE